MSVRLSTTDQGQRELRIFGNRAGLLSLANVLFWLLANCFRREFLSLAELLFVTVEGKLSVYLRLTEGEDSGFHGVIQTAGDEAILEWSISDDDLARVALLIHRLVCVPGHEYDTPLMSTGSFMLHIRMSDAAIWL